MFLAGDVSAYFIAETSAAMFLPKRLLPKRLLPKLGAAYVLILLSEVEQVQKPSENGDLEAIVVGAVLCDGEGERAYSVYDLILGEKYLIYFERFVGAKTGYGSNCRKTISETQFAEREAFYRQSFKKRVLKSQ